MKKWSFFLLNLDSKDEKLILNTVSFMSVWYPVALSLPHTTIADS